MMMDENGMEIVKKRSGLLGFLLIKKERTSIVVLLRYSYLGTKIIGTI
jgi:hypothetical protein